MRLCDYDWSTILRGDPWILYVAPGKLRGVPKYQNIGYIVDCLNSRVFSVFGAYQRDRKLEGGGIRCPLFEFIGIINVLAEEIG